MSYLPNILKLLAAIHYSDNTQKVTYQTIQDYLIQNNVELGDSTQIFIRLISKIFLI